MLVVSVLVRPPSSTHITATEKLWLLVAASHTTNMVSLPVHHSCFFACCLWDHACELVLSFDTSLLMPVELGSSSESVTRARVPQHRISDGAGRSCCDHFTPEVVSSVFHVAGHSTSALDTARIRSDCMMINCLGGSISDLKPFRGQSTGTSPDSTSQPSTPTQVPR